MSKSFFYVIFKLVKEMEVLDNLRFNRVARLMYKSFKKGQVKHTRDRNWSGFIFCLEGQVTFEKDGNKYTIDPGHVILVPQGGNYDVYIDEDSICPMIDFILDSEQFTDLYLFEIAETESFYHSYKKIEKIHIFANESYELRSLMYLYDVTARINGYGVQNEKFAILKEAEKYIGENISNPKLSIEDLASVSNVSPVYFRRLFKEKYGYSPYQYIENVRMNKAKELLTDEANIQSISEQCGYASIYSFSRAFKKSVGISPKAFKDKYFIKSV